MLNTKLIKKRNQKQTTKTKTNKQVVKNNQAKNIFYSKSKLNQVFVLALPNRQLLCRISGNAISIQLYLKFGKLFHIYKLIHIDLKPGILIASFLLVRLLNSQC